MKSIIQKLTLLTVIILITVTGSNAQRVIKGTVYMKGEPAPGVTVEAHRGGSMMTSFDGKYEVPADAKTKWLKFTFIDESRRFELEENSGDEVDFYFDDIKPLDENTEPGVSNKTLEQLTKEKDVEFMQEYSLYEQSYKMDEYKTAFPHWENVYKRYPKSTKNVYIHGVEMYEKFFEDAPNWEEKEKQIKKCMEVYDKRIKHFGQKGYVLGRKGTAWLDFYRKKDDLSIEERKEVMKKGYEWLNESAKERGIDSETPVIVLLMQTSSALFNLGELPKETVVKNYEFCNDLMNQMIAGDDKEKAEKAKEHLPYIEDIFSRSGAADCEALINIYTPQYEQNKDDVEFLKTMLTKLRKAKCEDFELVNVATERLYELEPSAEAAFNMARYFLKREDYTKAKEYYKQAMDQETDNELLATYYYEYGRFVFITENALQEGRNYAKKALGLKSDYCEALILVGDIYVAASRSFSDDAFETSTVFWVAVDYFNRAARVSEDCIADASQKAATYKAYFPDKEEGFFNGLTEGQSYKVEGWINEATRVRY